MDEGGLIMDFSKFTNKAGEAVQDAMNLAMARNHQEITSLHLLLALTDQSEGLIGRLLVRMGDDPGQLSDAIEKKISKLPSISGGADKAYMSVSLKTIFDLAFEEMNRLGDDFVSVEHLFLALLSQTDVSEFLKLDRNEVLEKLAEIRGGQKITTPDPEGVYEALEKYTDDLTQLAAEGKIDPVIGRDNEIRRIMQILSRRSKNNPVLVGEPGVGKTAIVEGLALQLATDVEPILKRLSKKYDFYFLDGEPYFEESGND